MTKRATIPISASLLKLVLDLPEGMRVVGAQYDHPGDEVWLQVESDDVEDGAVLMPVYSEVTPKAAILESLEGWELETLKPVNHV